jgi:mannose-1-phosphate guanylyltransferase
MAHAPIRNAFVLGAGLGTRLLSLTARKPKPLIPVAGKPLITFAFDHLIGEGITRLVVNTHHCHDAYRAAFPDSTYRGLPIHFAHETDLLETGGGIKNVEPLLGGEPFVVYNGDILTDLPLGRAISHHQGSGNEVTMVLRSGGGPLHVSLDESTGRVVDIAHRLRHRIAPKFLFTGIYVVNPEFLARIPAQTKISVIPVFMQMIAAEAKLGGIVLDEGHWWDLGTRESYIEVHRHFRAEAEGAGSVEWVHPRAKVAPDAQLLGATAVGDGARIGAGASLNDCVVWEDAEVAENSVLHHCIVTAGARAGGIHTNFDF